MLPHEFRPEKKVLAAAAVTVAANYVYFLLFAQFGFLKILQAATGGAAGVVKPVMAVMGLAGIGASVLAARIFSLERSRRVLAAGFALNALAAGLALLGGPLAVYYLVALLVGLGIGLTSVTLAGILRPAVGDARLGIIIGLGTGVAYGFCNLPMIFSASATMQAGLGLLATAAGLVGAWGLELRAPVVSPAGGDYSRAGAAVWVLFFFALVGLDSAAFYIIQHNPVLKDDTWTGGWHLGVNAGMHVGAALLAGWALDRRWLGRTVLMGAVALLAACALINGNSPAYTTGALLYTAGVSVYSTALVFYPARGQRPGLAALVYAVAGWGGSALGIGLAENRRELPAMLMTAVAVIIISCLLIRRWRQAPGAMT